jgi:ATP-binding protein involved in chromosome partitioning
LSEASGRSVQIPRTMPQTEGALVGVRNAVAIASAKGGVGKSTVAAHLAFSLQRAGARVGLLDADIYGPSLPLLTGVREAPEATAEGRLIPVVRDGVALMSIGLLAGEDAPVVWRGPLLAQAVQTFLSQVEWGPLDLLLIDLPPGTGDIPLTLSQTVALSGAVMVTTPQDVALQDVERGVAMLRKVAVEVLGIVENMSYYLCPHCGARHELFGAGGGQDAAERLGLELLGQVPLDGDLSLPEEGRTAALRSGDSRPMAVVFDRIAERVVAALSRMAEDA